MNFLSNRIVALFLWVLPVLLVVIGVALTRAGFEQREVFETGDVVTAEIIEILTQERSEISRGHVRLRYTIEGSLTPEDRTVELPMTFLKDLELSGTSEVDVKLLPDRGQVVIAQHGRGQWIMTLSFAAMAFFGALGLGWMVAGWNRYLRRHGDPAESDER